MTMNLHAASAPIFSQMLANLDVCLGKAEAFAQARRFDSANYLALRLAPDMLPLASQIRIASDIARMTMARLAGVDMVRYADDELTIDALRQRLRQSCEVLSSFDAAVVNAAEDREIVLPQRTGEPLRFNGCSLLQRWALPNFFFHVTTAYALLRHAGVEVGKADFLGV
ncbi:MAG: DUF1993 domain-containing protein [Aquincola sp.]|nr:DUF1993 domain-containing protein [Aquincola sp.]|tara:strand:+ start:9735 stop:10241 length:507 start_codon:yes stop_codon:yes gene_type:complete